MIRKMGELNEHMIAAVQQHNATQHTEVRVRIGTMGPVYAIDRMVGEVVPGIGGRVLLQLSPVSEER
jgi:hypothetical protein